MNEPDYDDPDVEDHWCLARRNEVETYLRRQELAHGELGEWPAWHKAPFVSIWAVENLRRQGWVGWWVVCGDLPTDYIEADDIKRPRAALRAIGERWTRVLRGEPVTDCHVSKELLPLLESRAGAVLALANDDQAWAPEAHQGPH